MVPNSPQNPRTIGGIETAHRELPLVLAQCARTGGYAFVMGAVLMGLAFITNPVPDPSFPWATLPDSMRIGFAQPRIEHWPVSYTVGLWLIVFSLPLAIIDAYRRTGRQRFPTPRLWFTAVPVAFMFTLTTYCRFFWPKLHPATWNAPSYTLVCWGYCSTYIPLWSNLAYAVALLGVGATLLIYRNAKFATHSLAIFGVLAFPLGIPALYEAYQQHTSL